MASPPLRLAALALVTLGLPGLPALTSTARAAGTMYCCNDAGGRQACGDILPQACYGRAYREVGDHGRTLRTIGAPLSAEQRAAIAAEEARRKVEQDALREQQRKDQALMNTYGSEKDIDLMRERAEADVFKSIKASETRIAEARQRRKKFENEAEFYKKKPLPNEVKRGLSDVDLEIRAHESIIDAKKKELDVVRAKYDEDKRRYADLARRSVLR